MRKLIPIVGMLLAYATMPTAQAQITQVKPAIKREQGRITKDLEQRYTANHQRALQLARKHGWVITETTKEGATLSLQSVDDRGMPVYYVSYNNTRAAATTSTDKVWAGGTSNLNLSGNNPALAGKLGIWDAGRVRTSHREFGGRVVIRDGAASNDNHATHVAGTMIAAGLTTPARGMAFGAANLQAWDFNLDIPEISAAAGNLLVSNHSYGSTAGWRYNGNRSPRWEWWGDISLSTTEDNKFGQYNFQTHDFDKIAYYAPYYLMVKAVGNNRTENGPGEGASFWRINAARTAWELVETRPPGMSSNNGFESIPTYGNAKNLLMVGSVEPIEEGYKDPSQVKIAANSSWGPTDDGRIKPDLVGNGINVYSPIAANDEAYAGYSGTSMASPNVAGSLFLLQEHYANLHNGAFLRAATLKGLAIHTADEAGGAPGPDYVHGWGLLNTEKAAAVISNTGNRHGLFERALSQNETYSFQVTAAGSGPMVVTISWTDPEGAVSSSALLNDRSPRLVNDLDVRVARGFDTFRPWILDPANPSFPATFGDNIRDNVEQVFIANPVPGESYTITIGHKGTIQRGPQAYSLLVSGINSQTYCVSRAQSEADSRIAHSQLGSLTHTPAGCSAFRDLTGLLQQVYPGQQVPFRFTLGTCGTDFSKAARIFADWNSDGDFEDTGEMIATSGVFSGTGDFTGSFTIPAATIKVGDLLRLRIVMAETDLPEQVQACGLYAKGETQDFLLQVVPPSMDVGVTSLVFPTENLCAYPSQPVTVSVRNFGSASQTGITVRTEVEDQDGQVTVLQGVYRQPLAPLREASLTLEGTFEAVAGKTYTFRSHTSLPDDQNPENDTHTTTRTVAGAFPVPVAKALICGNDPVTLQASGEGTMFWYDALRGGNLLATGHQTLTSFRPADNLFYVAANDFSGSFGPKTKEAFAGGGYNQYTTDLHFTTQVPLVLEKARLYIGHPGRIIFSLFTTNDELVSTAHLDVEATRTPAAPGSQPNDGTDAGAVYDLNLAFPQAGDYVLKVTYQNGATIFRNNAGVTGYPFTIPQVVSLTGTSVSPLFYYFLYDLQVKSTGCPSTRVPVRAEEIHSPEARIIPSGPVSVCESEGVLLKTPQGEGYAYQWQKDGADIEGATTDKFKVTAAGAYSVRITNPQNPEACASTLSEAVVVTIIPPSPVAISTSGPSVFCEGGSVTMTASEGNSYLWSTGETTRSITARTAGEYGVTVTNQQGCPAPSAPVVVTVLPAPSAQLTADGPTTFCQGGAVRLTASSGSQYLWSTGQTTQSITVTGTGAYFVTVRNEQGCSATSEPVHVTAEPPITPNLIPSGQSVCLGAVPTALQGSQPAGGTGEYFYLWESSSTGPDLGFSPAPGFNKGRDYAPQPLQQSTWFRRRCLSGSCESVSAVSFLSVKMPPAASIAESSATTFCQGGSTVLTAQGGSKYLWSTGATTPSITVTENGTYTANVLNEDDCSTVTSAVTVTVKQIPGAPTVTQTQNRMESSFASGNQWYWNGKPIEGATSQELEVFRPGTYTVVSTQNGCTSAPSAPLLYKAILDESTLKLAVGPNPNVGKFKLFFEVHGLEDAQLHLVNTMGKNVYQQLLPQLSGKQSVEVDAPTLSAGIYLVQLRFRDKVFVRKVMIKH